MAGDPTSSHPELGGGYIAYSASGTASGQAVFVNYGLPADYAQLSALGVAVKDRIAIARYGRSHRAVKVHTAQEHGARALVLYSDPADDGAAKGPVWPDGYWRGPDMLQRGNAKLSWFWHGDPLTPGVGATAGCAASRSEGRADAAEDSGGGHQRRRGAACRVGARRSGAAGVVPERHRRRHARRAGPGGPSCECRHGSGRAPDLRRGRVVPRTSHARARDSVWHASRRVDVRRRRSRNRDHGDARDGQGPRPAGQGRMASAADDLAGLLGRRGVRPGRFDRIRRGAEGAAPGATRHVREHRHVHEGPVRPRRCAVVAGVRRRCRQGRPGRQQQRLRPVAAGRMDRGPRRRGAADR